MLTAAGSGERFGGSAPKALVPFGDMPLVAHAARALQRAGVVQQLVVTAPAGRQQEIGAAVVVCCTVPTVVVAGGPSRQASVAAGLAALSDCDVTLVHDAARPLASPELIRALVHQVQSGDDAVVPGVAVTDTIKEVDGASVPHAIRTIERSALRAIQTPQAFRTGPLRRAHAAAADLARSEATAISDDAGVVERVGVPVRVIDGEARAMKITTPDDLALAEFYLREER